MALLEMTAFSQCLKREVEFYVILPDKAPGSIGIQSVERPICPTLYLLHGMSDDHSIWLRRTSIERYAAEKGIAVVMPTTDLGFYTDMAKGDPYWQYITKELPAMCRSFFPQMSTKREDTFVAGLSMGGYGALKCGLRASETFSCAAGLSSVCDIVETVEKNVVGSDKYWQDVFGKKSALPGSFNDLMAAAEDYANNPVYPLHLYQWCGTEDFLYAQNVKFRKHAEKLGLDLTYEESPGVHSWKYWDEKIQTILNWLPLQKEAK